MSSTTTESLRAKLSSAYSPADIQGFVTLVARLVMDHGTAGRLRSAYEHGTKWSNRVNPLQRNDRRCSIFMKLNRDRADQDTRLGIFWNAVSPLASFHQDEFTAEELVRISQIPKVCLP